jgi:hypothetical protein
MASNIYFSKDTEAAIVEYVLESDQTVRDRLYKTRIDRAFNKLVENLIHKYKFYNYEVSYEDAKHEVISFLIEKLHKFKAEKGKAYSYFTVIGRNYLIAKNKSHYNKIKTKEELSVIDDTRDLLNEISNSEKQSELKDFLDIYVTYCDANLSSLFSKLRDIQIANAVLELFRRRENIEEFNKKALYIMIREMTDSSTHDISKVVNVLRKKYQEMYIEYQKNSEFLETP